MRGAHRLGGDAVAAGRLSVDTANSLRRGLGEPADGVTPEMLHDALDALIAGCAGPTAGATSCCTTAAGPSHAKEPPPTG